MTTKITGFCPVLGPHLFPLSPMFFVFPLFPNIPHEILPYDLNHCSLCLEFSSTSLYMADFSPFSSQLKLRQLKDNFPCH